MEITSTDWFATQPVGAAVYHRTRGEYVRQADGKWQNAKYKTRNYGRITFARSVVIHNLRTEPWR